MAIDMFLDLGKKMPGESKDAQHKDSIDVESWKWKMRQPSAGKVDVADLELNKWVDKASPVLMLYCANGDRIPKATLTVRRAGKQALEYVVFELDNVRISSVETTGAGGDDKLMERVTLAFTHVTVHYTPQKADGTGDASVDFVWDVERNVSE